MVALGFTGTRNIMLFEDRLFDWFHLPETRLWLKAFDTYVTGGCRGWDAWMGERLALAYPNATHLVIVPGNRSQIDPWWMRFDLGAILAMYMPADSSYRDRNAEIVSRSNQLFYCAEYPEHHGHSARSGTWMTVRIARQAGIPLSGITLNKDGES